MTEQGDKDRWQSKSRSEVMKMWQVILIISVHVLDFLISDSPNNEINSSSWQLNGHKLSLVWKHKHGKYKTKSIISRSLQL